MVVNIELLARSNQYLTGFRRYGLASGGFSLPIHVGNPHISTGRCEFAFGTFCEMGLGSLSCKPQVGSDCASWVMGLKVIRCLSSIWKVV